MPIYEFRCPNGHLSEEIWHLASDAPHEIDCPYCTNGAYRIISKPIFHCPEIDQKTGRKIFKGDPFEGTPLEGTDGVNEVQYDAAVRSGNKSKKIWMEMHDGRKGRDPGG